MNEELARTPLHDWHVAHRGRMVDFAGWSMPVQYSSIGQEHQATRNAAGLFDISHMGRLRFESPGAAAFLDRMLTRRVLALQPGQIRYALVTNDQGGVLDDVLIYRLQGERGHDVYMLVVNASNRLKIVQWLHEHSRGERFADVTTDTGMIAVQGPHALTIVRQAMGIDVTPLDYYSGIMTTIDGQAAVVSRTGYTGEDGCELILSADVALNVWQRLLAAGSSLGALPAGLGARDTLRLEAAMPLYGHELNEQIDPFQAGLGFAVQLKDHDFPGRELLEQLKSTGQHPRRVGLQLEGRRVARQHCPILHGEQQVGEVTSGTFSPTLEQPIAMGYVSPQVAEIGTQLAIDIRGRREAARVVQLPFYRRST